jgi:hypothetical protein
VSALATFQARDDHRFDRPSFRDDHGRGDDATTIAVHRRAHPRRRQQLQRLDDGSWMYIISGKSVTRPNPGHLASRTASITSYTYPGGNAAAAAASRASNQYQFQLERASLVSAPVPNHGHLQQLTDQVANAGRMPTDF